MARDHYLPASFIGRFSNDYYPGTRSRDHVVWAGYLGSNQPVQQKASSLGYGKGLYDLHSEFETAPMADSIDSWKYEKELPRVLDTLCSGERLSLSDWLHVAVPFVAGQFVRGPEFNERYKDRLSDLWPTLNENCKRNGYTGNVINFARVIEMQSFLLPVMAARWKVIHAVGGYRFILNDMGMTPIFDIAEQGPGWAIPLDTRTVLFLVPKLQRCFGTYGRDGRWHALVEHLDEPDIFFNDFNKLTANTSQRFIVGSDPNTIERLLPLISKKTPQQLRAYRDSGWQAKRGIATASDDCIMWGAAADIADNDIPPGRLKDYKTSAHHVNANRWAPLFLALQEYSDMGNGRLAFFGNNLIIKQLA